MHPVISRVHVFYLPPFVETIRAPGLYRDIAWFRSVENLVNAISERVMETATSAF